jgi:hypothetical protein
MAVTGVTSFPRQREHTPCFAVAYDARECSHALSLSVAVWARRCLPGRILALRGGRAAACKQARRSAGRIPSTTTESTSCRNSRSAIPARTTFISGIEGLPPVTSILEGTSLRSVGVNGLWCDCGWSNRRSSPPSWNRAMAACLLFSDAWARSTRRRTCNSSSPCCDWCRGSRRSQFSVHSRWEGDQGMESVLKSAG